MNTTRITMAAKSIDENRAALKWLEEYGARFTGDRNEATISVSLFTASACPGAKEAQKVIESFAMLSLPDLIKTATDNCRNTIEINESIIRQECGASAE